MGLRDYGKEATQWRGNDQRVRVGSGRQFEWDFGGNSGVFFQYALIRLFLNEHWITIKGHSVYSGKTLTKFWQSRKLTGPPCENLRTICIRITTVKWANSSPVDSLPQSQNWGSQVPRVPPTACGDALTKPAHTVIWGSQTCDENAWRQIKWSKSIERS